MIKMNRKIVCCLTLVLVAILIFSFALLYPYLTKEEDMDELHPSPFEIPKVYGFSVFTYEADEINVEKPVAPQYSFPLNLEEVENIDRFFLNNEAREKLSNNGFVVLPGKYTDIAEFYKNAEEAGIPVFITTDSVLFVYHAFFDTILMQLEEEHFIPILEKLLTGLVKEADSVYGKMPDNTLAKKSALLNVAYLSTALKLLNPSFEPPTYVRDLVSKELSLIGKASDPEYVSPIFSYKEDYTQYRPRGHYTKSEELKRYFKCMMWLGRMRFEAQDPIDPELAKVQTAQALQLTYLMVSVDVDGEKALVLWEKIYLPTAFIVGKSDDLSFYDYIRVMKEIYPSFAPANVNDETRLKEFMDKIVKLDESKIVSSPIFPYEKPRLVGLRFMGQRFILDGYIHQQLCYPNLPTRLKVRGLDIMAALGSERAMELLEEDFKKYSKFYDKLVEVRDEISQLKPENWTETLYMGWLYSIKALLYEPSSGYPSFMTTEAWLDKSLNTALASWAQLRHDTILYAKQPYAGKTAIPPKQPHPGYVEPNPLLYSRLRNLVYATKKGLESLGLLDKQVSEKLSVFAELLDKLVDISVKELKSEKLSDEDTAFMKSYGYRLESLLSVAEPRTKDPRIIADVFTEPNSNTVLEVGTGYFDNIIVVYKTPDGKLYASTGLTMSYYEFYWPQTDRLTDEKWAQMLESGKAPEQLPWIYNFKIKP